MKFSERSHLVSGLIPLLLTVSALGTSEHNPRRNADQRQKSGFDNIFTAISDMASRAKSSFSSSLLPAGLGGGRPNAEDRSDSVSSDNPGRSKSSHVGQQSHFKEHMVGTQQNLFKEPTELLSFTKANLGPFKRDAQKNGYLYPKPSNPLLLPSEKLTKKEPRVGRTNSIQDKLNLISFSDGIENGPSTQRLQGRLRTSQEPAVTSTLNSLANLEDILQESFSASSSEVNRGFQRSSEDNRGLQRSSEVNRGQQRSSEVNRGQQRSSEVNRGQQRSSEVDSASPRNFVVQEEEKIIRVPQVTISSTPGNFRIIQPIQIVSSTRRPVTLAPRRRQQRPRVPKQQSGGAITFQDNPLAAVLGRQVAGRPVEGFPTGLPANTPLGVRIVLENMFGADGEMNMPAIPGEAGTDYPVFTSVPDTGFSCSAQDQPGIYTDTGAECQSFYMCEASGEATGFLCPNGTIFNQQYFVCDWWYNLDCAEQPSFYSLNAALNDETLEGRSGCKTLFCLND